MHNVVTPLFIVYEKILTYKICENEINHQNLNITNSKLEISANLFKIFSEITLQKLEMNTVIVSD